MNTLQLIGFWLCIAAASLAIALVLVTLARDVSRMYWSYMNERAWLDAVATNYGLRRKCFERNAVLRKRITERIVGRVIDRAQPHEPEKVRAAFDGERSKRA